MDNSGFVDCSSRPSVCRRLALEILVLTLTIAGIGSPGAAQAQVNVVGQWQTLGQTVPINPIHAALLRTGRVLIVAGSENDPTVTTYRATVWDPVTGAFATQSIPWDLFCNAMTFLPDGRVLTVGGNLQYNPFRGIRTTTVFDPATEQFSQVQDMAHGRWYPSSVALADGRTMTFSGWLETGGTNEAVELYTLPSGWGPELLAPFTPPLYPWLHLLPDGRVFESGPQIDSHVFNPATQTWTTDVAETLYPNERTYGSSVLLPLRPSEGYRARIMIMGGDNPATDSAEIIDLSQPAAAWRALPPMSAPRIQMSAVLLPTGKVLALGGSSQNNVGSTASLNADLFDPNTETWSPAGRMARPRMYHSVALLLPDATVWVTGSNPEQGSYDGTIEVYRPAYLFAPNGAPAARPSISAAPAAVGYNASFPVTTPNAADIASVALVRAGSSTHAFNFEQRVVNLSFTASGGVLTLTSPPNANIAPPGYYMLFLINSAGVPSQAAWVRLATNPDNQPPDGTITAPTGDVTIQAGQSVTFAGSGTDPDGTVTGYRWSFPGGTPATSTSASPGAVTFSEPGTYDAMLVVTDNAGGTDPSPPRRRITVQPASLVATISSPAAGATVAGTQPVGMTLTHARGTSNTFTLTLDGVQLFTTTISGTTASFDWNTTTVGDGVHTLSLTGLDATGATDTATRTITVNNGGTPLNDINVTFPTLSPGQTVGGVTTVRISTDNTAGANNRFAISVDGIAQDLIATGATSVDWPWNTAAFPNGSHTISVTVTDATGRRGIGSDYVTVQNSLVVAITSPASGATVSGTGFVDVWVEGQSGTANAFTLIVAGRIVASQTISGRHATLAWNTTQVPDGAQTLLATVVDAANNGGHDSRPVTVQNGSAPPPLAASFTTPAAGATVAGTVTVGLAASGGTAPYTYRLSIDGAQVFSTTTSATSATFAWNTTTVANGSHALGLTVTDSASGSASATRGVTVQNTSTPPPLAASFTTPAAGATVAGTVTVGLAASGGTAPYTYRLSIDGAQVFSTTTSATSATFAWNTTTVANGSHALGLTVTDSASGSASATRGVTVQNTSTPPLAASFTSPAAGATVAGTVTVGLAASSGTAPYTYRLSVDGAQVFSTTTSATSASFAWNTTTVANGSHALGLTVTDSASGSASATRGVTVSNTSTGTLRVALTTPTPGSTVSGTVWVNIWVDGATAGSNAYTMTVGSSTVWSERLDQYARGAALGHDEHTERAPDARGRGSRCQRQHRQRQRVGHRAEWLGAAAARRVVYQPGGRRHRRRHRHRRPGGQQRHRALHLSP